MLGLRPLEMEIGTEDYLAKPEGSHDLFTWNVQLFSERPILTTRHEAFHDRIMYETPFGTTHLVFNYLRKKCKNPKIRDLANKWTELLLLYSRKTHEREAIYLSIKSFPIEEHEDLLSLHPKEYKEYYWDVSSVVDSVFQSSYMQFLVGNKILEICFASDLQARLSNWSPNDPPDLKDADSPDSRFSALSNFLTEERLKDLLSYLENNYHKQKELTGLVNGFDINQEDCWLSIPRSLGNSLDGVLEDLIRQWLYNIALSIFPCIPHSDWLRVRRVFFNNVESKTSTSIPFSVQNDITPLAPKSEEEFLLKNIGRIARHAIASIRNPLCSLEKPPDPIPKGGNLFGVFSSGQKPHCFISYSHELLPESEPFWIYETGSGAAAKRTLVSHEQMSNFLKTIMILGLASGRTFSYDALIVRPTDFGTQTFTEIYDQIITYHCKEIGRKLITFNTDKLCWYVSGDLVESYYLLKSLGPLEFLVATRASEEEARRMCISTNGNPSLLSIRETDMQSDQVGYCIFVMRSKKLFGLFCRILTTEGTNQIIRLINHDMKKGDPVNVIPEDDRSAVGEICSLLIDYALSNWSVI